MKEESTVLCARIFIAVLVLAALPGGAVPGAHAAEEGRLVDLTLLQADPALDSWADRHRTDLYPCLGETPSGAILGTIRAGALILGRDRAKAQPSSRFLSQEDEGLLFDTADLSLGTATGFDITVLTAISQILELETRYFGIHGWDDSRIVRDPAGMRLEGFGVVAPLGNSERIDYGSELYNFEINLRPRVAAGMPLILGFRTLQLHERFSMWRLESESDFKDLAAHTNNFLYGVQIGAEPYLLGAGGPLTLEGVLKAGIYANHANQGTESPLLATAVGASRNRASFVGEIGLMIDYRFSRFFAIRGGYELLWLYGVALAPDQGATTDLLVPSAALNCSATAFYQGAAVSLEFVF